MMCPPTSPNADRWLTLRLQELYRRRIAVNNLIRAIEEYRGADSVPAVTFPAVVRVERARPLLAMAAVRRA